MSSSTTDSATAEVTMPQMGVSAAEGTVIAWTKEVGDWIEADETICEISTDKIDSEVPAPVTGRVSEILVQVDETVAVGAVLARIATDSSPGQAHAAEHIERARHHSPVVRRIAAEHGVDLETVTGTGRGGRVRKQDVLAVVEASEQRAEPAGGQEAEPAREAGPEPPLHIESPYRPEPAHAAGEGGGADGAGDDRGGGRAGGGEPLSRVRRSIAEHMVRSLRTAAHCTTIVEADMSRVEAGRARIGTTYLPWVARAAIDALRELPALNATLDGEMLTLHEDVNLGIAVSLGDEGLIVPVVHRAHELSVEGLAARITQLARRARDGELTADDVAGGTFTITNPGAFGAIAATPIINQPQVAILDLEAVVKRPVVVPDGAGGDAIAVRPMANLCMSWDHRALDGALAARFLSTVKRNLESAGTG